MNVLIAVSLIGVIISPNPNPFDAMTQESYSGVGVGVNDIVPCDVVNPVGSSSVSSWADKAQPSYYHHQHKHEVGHHACPKSRRR